MRQIICRRCGSLQTVRMPRKNIFEKTILHLGLHPWKCITCSHVFFSRDRGPRRDKEPSRHQTGEATDH